MTAETCIGLDERIGRMKLWPVEIDTSVPLLPEMVSKIDLSKRMSDF